ncbi:MULTISPECIES: ATP-binding protein [unclassified Lysinibacillus]|uniref:AlbA family DNA-binding domain-containing protein n=1 Tax=unclassified Lysinibacillus TaxID=2636778 RepID=UPI00255347C8|nr:MULTISPECIES: ATP-binding protein [unclassified Lysinibacillus]MDM5245912.1 ATP-binding protein [Lysinibacillus sp. G4S2]
MNWQKSPTLEWKREVTNNIQKAVIAFANTIGGELYIGVDDDGQIIGLENAQQALEVIYTYE